MSAFCTASAWSWVFDDVDFGFWRSLEGFLIVMAVKALLLVPALFLELLGPTAMVILILSILGLVWTAAASAADTLIALIRALTLCI